MKKTKKTAHKKTKEEYRVSGKDVVNTIKKLVKEGNVRHVVVKIAVVKFCFSFLSLPESLVFSFCQSSLVLEL